MITADGVLISLAVSGALGLVGWGLKEGMKALVSTLLKFMARVEMLDAKLGEVIKMLGDYPKMKQDLNLCYTRIRELETKLEEHSH